MKSFGVKATLVCVAPALLVWAWTAANRRALGPWVDKSEPVTVISVTFGRAGKYSNSSYVHRVRTDTGTDYQMVFGEILPKGARVWVNYRHYTRSNRTRLTFYYRCDKTC